MKLLYFFSVLFLIGFQAGAQTAQFRVISCTGDVKVKLKDASVKKVHPGDKLEPEGTLLIGERGYLKLICKDKPHLFEEKGEYKLSELYTLSMQQSMSFTSKFWGFIMEGLKKSDTKEDLISYHKSYMSVSGGVKGYTESNDNIRILAPMPKKLPLGTIQVKWVAKSNGPYIVSLLEKKSGKVLFNNSTEKQFLSLNINDFGVQEKSSYLIRVKDPLENSSEITVVFQELNETRIQSKLESLIDYQNSDEFERKWMKAIILEMEGYVYSANALYEELLRDHPNHPLLKKIYNSFLARTDRLDELVQ